MHRLFTEPRKSTIVRFITAILPVVLATGCGTVASIGSENQTPSTAGPAICQSFGPETRCSHADSTRVTRELERLNRSAGLGFRGW